jgi:hypothetical protein
MEDIAYERRHGSGHDRIDRRSYLLRDWYRHGHGERAPKLAVDSQ